MTGFIFLVVIIVNVCMKFAGVIDWSWWLVFWPLWFDLGWTALLLLRYAINKWCEDTRY